MSIENEDLSGKVILEVGSGRGDSTRKIVDCLLGEPHSQLIVTDISDSFFQSLQDEFQSKDVQVRFICTGAQELRGIPDDSIDFIVCNYTLCAVNSQAGLAALALKRFWEVLKSNGKLFVEDEFPPDGQNSSLSEVWIEKWRILKSGMVLTGQSIFNEISPDVLENLCYLAGFEKVEWVSHSELHRGSDVLNFFQRRLDALLKEIPNEDLRAGFAKLAVNLQNKAIQAGGMEVPFYRLIAQKNAG
jgi:ubiquinone/menaquinone biosynthesis C-methylase UbiE